jgi:trimeric autotransporter adhesin
MRTSFRAALLAVLAAAAIASPAAAQSDILLRLRSGSPAGDRFRVDSAGGMIALGKLGYGIIPATGCGERLMWHPFKAAFRAGSTNDSATCSYWDDINIGFYSWAGGYLTKASAFGTFAFGDQVSVGGVDGAAFGSSNTVNGTAGFATGADNSCGGFGCVAMGFTNTASGQGSVAIGYRVTADASYSVALGHRASANGKTGVFIIGDQSTTDSIEASVNNQFSARYAGGYRLYTNATTTVGVSLNAGGSTWNAISDRNRKELFLPVDGESVLARIRGMPVTTWRYIDEEDRSIRHMGPMAQDWDRAFGFSGDSTTINTGDFDGVNFAAVKALEERTAQLAARVAEVERLRAEVAALRAETGAQQAENAEFRERLARLEALPQP